MDPAWGMVAQRPGSGRGSGLEAAFPRALHADVAAVLAVIPAASLSPARSFDVSIAGERVRIPYRLYADEPAADAHQDLTLLQQAVLSCIYTRHHDGHVRQRHVERIVPQTEDWIAPFVVHLTGEYVLEIVLRIKDELVDIRLPGTARHTVYGRFAAANPDFITLTSQRSRSGSANVCSFHSPRYARHWAPSAMDVTHISWMSMFLLASW